MVMEEVVDFVLGVTRAILMYSFRLIYHWGSVPRMMNGLLLWMAGGRTKTSTKSEWYSNYVLNQEQNKDMTISL